MTNQTLTLLSGTKVTLGALSSFVLPEVIDNLNPGDVVTLVNEKAETLGTATVKDVKVSTFALLQNRDLGANAHPEMGSWPNAYETLRNSVQGFSQNDKVTVVLCVVITQSDSGVTVSIQPAQKDEEDTIPETIGDVTEEDIAAFATIVEDENQ